MDSGKMKFLVIGSGMQGRACAYDMLRQPDTSEVTLADSSAASLKTVRATLKDPRVKTKILDASDAGKAQRLMKGKSAVVSCVPYFLNLELAKAAIAAKTHYVDLGGNTDIVRQELALHKAAVKAGVTVLPDVGLGPGMTTTIAVHGMQQLDVTEEVYIRDGGLPQKPVAPMNYMLTFSEHGLINEYVEPATALRNGRVVKVPGLSEIEQIDVPSLGRCEAAHASGGLSTLAETYAGKVKTMDCKLIRYPGHCAVINAMSAMGFFDQTPIEVGSRKLKPRDLSAALFRRHFSRPGDKDLVVIHTTVRGLKSGRRVEIVYDMVDHFDEKTGMTAMMRTTGFPASIVALMLGRGVISKPGAYPVETGIPAQAFLGEMKRRGFAITWKVKDLGPASSKAPAFAQ